MLVINEIIWEYDFSWSKIRKQLRMNPLFFLFLFLFLVICSLNFVKNTGRMTGRVDEDMMFENTEMASSSGNLSSRRKEKSEEKLSQRKCDTGPDRQDWYFN